MKKTILLMVLLFVLVIGGLLGWTVYINLQESRLVESARVGLRDAMISYGRENDSLVSFCHSEDYQRVAGTFEGSINCQGDDQRFGDNLVITLETANDAWNCGMFQSTLEAAGIETVVGSDSTVKVLHCLNEDQ